MDNRVAAKYLALVLKKREHEDAAKDLDEQIKTLENRLIENMTQAGMARFTLDGHTLYIDRKLWASAVDGNTPVLAAALKEVGLESLVSETVHGQRLASWVREFDPDKALSPEEVIAKLPEVVRPHIKVSEVIKLNVRKG